MTPTIREERLKIPTVHGGQLFLRCIEQQESSRAVVLMLHGLGSSGDVFIGEGHGLANYLSELGFTCYVPDLIGHGQSWPHISRHLEHSVHDIVEEDLVRIFSQIEKTLNGRPLYVVGQGFGSVLLLSAFAKHPLIQKLTEGFVHFNARRSTTISGASHRLLSKALWRKLMNGVGAVRGDVPLHWTSQANQPEALSWYRTFLNWSEGDWVDEVDQFNYAAKIRALTLPPSLYLASRSQGYWSNTADVREFMRELGTHNARMLILAKGDGNLRNYNSLSMLQHDDAWVDHFPVILDWLNERIRQQGQPV
ncbi:alpha/beta hydrolase [Reinekea marina]|uniref:Alpha/beta hydrolase n=2 Tax=Reinekea marina TaxID=1310421 RepID=A0ABV7WTN2_9GAMM